MVWYQSKCGILGLMIFMSQLTSARGGSYYNRYDGMKMKPTSASSWAILNSYILASLTSTRELSVCAASCNANPSCKVAQLQKSAQICQLFSVAPEGSRIAELTGDADYISLTLSSIADKTPQSTGETLRTNYFDKILTAAKQPPCWSQYDSNVLYSAEPLDSDTSVVSDLAYSSNNCTLNSGVFKEPAPFMRLLDDSRQSAFCMVSPTANTTWWQIDLQRIAWITSVSFSRSYGFGFAFRIHYSMDGVTFSVFKGGSGVAKAYAMNVAPSGTYPFHQPILARYLKMYIQNDDGTTVTRCLRLSFSGCPALCADPLGLESNELADSQLTTEGASYDVNYPPSKARLNLGLGGLKASSVSPFVNLVIDLEKQTIVTGVQLQGCDIFNAWVTSFRVQYKTVISGDWTDLTDANTNSKFFKGNIDTTTVATSMFAEAPVTGQFFKISSSGYSTAVCFKAELIGCKNIPPYQTNLAQGKAVTVSAFDSQLADPSSVTESRLMKQTQYQTCTRVTPVSQDSRAILVVDLGSNQSINTVEIATPALPPIVTMNPDGLWLFDVMRGGDDLSGNGNHAILSSRLRHDLGIDGRPMGSIGFTSTTVKQSILTPLVNIGIDNRNGWTFLTWFYYSSIGSSGFNILRNVQNNMVAGFNFQITGSGNISLTTIANTPTLNAPNAGIHDVSVNVPSGRWIFLGFTLDCQSGIARLIVDGKPALSVYAGCQGNVMPMSHYAITDGLLIGRMACMQIYQRGLDQSEIEQASLCPWLTPAPAAIFPFNCSLSDVLGSGSFSISGTVSCSTITGFPDAAWRLGTGGSDYLYISSSSALSPRFSFTVLVSMNHDDSVIDGNIFGWYRTLTSGDSSMVLSSTNGVLSGSFSCLGSDTVVTTNLTEPASKWIRVHRWHMFGIVYDYQNSKISIVIDGIFIKTVTINCYGLATNQSYFVLGDGASQGAFAVLQIYKTALTANQIYSLRRLPITTAPSLVAAINTPLDKSWGSVSQDDSTPTFSVENSVSAATGFPWATNYNTFKLNGGESSNIQTPGAPATSWRYGYNSSARLTVGFWVYNQQTSANTYIVLNMRAAGGGPVFQLMSNPFYQWRYYCSNTWDSAPDAGLVNNKWQYHMISLKLDSTGSSITTFRDGYTLSSYTKAGCTPTEADTYVTIGQGGYSGWTGFTGQIACFAVFPTTIGQYLAMEIASQCPTPSMPQGHVCESDLTLQATVTFSTTLVASGITFNAYKLYGEGNASTPCCWASTTADTAPWIKLVFPDEFTISSLFTQGDPTNNCWVTSFYLKYSSTSAVAGPNYLDRATGNIKDFVGNWDTVSTAYHFLKPYIQASVLTVVPTAKSGSQYCMRLSVRGCPNFFCSAEQIGEGTISASSDLIAGHAAKAVIDNGFEWFATSTDLAPYYQITFSSGMKLITAILVQGTLNTTAWITKFHVVSSTTGNNKWIAYTWANNASRIRIFNGPTAGGASASPMTNYLTPPLLARGLRIVVDDYNGVPGGRFGFKGCDYTGVGNAVPPFLVRAGPTAPTSASNADSIMSRCGGGGGNIAGLPFATRTTATCDTLTGQYVAIVSSTAGSDMTICQVVVTYEPGTNFALLKTVTGSSDLAPSSLPALTNGGVGSGYVYIEAAYSWLIVDLGVPTPVSKIALASPQVGNAGAANNPYQIVVRVGNMNNETLNAVCDIVRDYVSPTYIPASSIILHCTPSITGRYVSIEKTTNGGYLAITFSEISVY